MGYSEQNRRSARARLPQRADAAMSFLRARRITSGRTLSTCSTSAEVDSRPSEKRTSEFASPSRLPALRRHAKAPMTRPSTLSRWRRKCPPNPALPAKACCPNLRPRKATVLASRRSREPTNCTPGNRSMSRISRSSAGPAFPCRKPGCGQSAPGPPPDQ